MSGVSTFLSDLVSAGKKVEDFLMSVAKGARHWARSGVHYRGRCWQQRRLSFTTW